MKIKNNLPARVLVIANVTNHKGTKERRRNYKGHNDKYDSKAATKKNQNNL
jgi:hypothetical protein